MKATNTAALGKGMAYSSFGGCDKRRGYRTSCAYINQYARGDLIMQLKSLSKACLRCLIRWSAELLDRRWPVSFCGGGVSNHLRSMCLPPQLAIK